MTIPGNSQGRAMIPVSNTSGEMSAFARTIYQNKYAHEVNGRKEEWPETARRVADAVVKPHMPHLTDRIARLIEDRKFMPGGRYLYAAGRRFPQVNNCFLFFADDSREGWGELMDKTTQSLMTGGGIGVVYSRLRADGSAVGGLGGKSSGPCALMQMVNEAGRHIRQGGSRRSAIWAGLHWHHPDVFAFIDLKDWPEVVRREKARDFNFPAPLDGTNVSVILDDDFFAAFHSDAHARHAHARRVYAAAVAAMVRSGEPGFSVDVGPNAGEHGRNACTEVTTPDDSDMCNLGSLNLARFATREEFAEGVELGTAFLLCGTLYSKLPFDHMKRTRDKNRRLGLGLMGLHEWALRRGHRFGGRSAELGVWLGDYARAGEFAADMADELGVSRPVKTRAVAPTGTISIVAETTSGIEPVFAVAYKRRYLSGAAWKHQYVIDTVAKSLIESGVDPDAIEDAVTLAGDVDRRVSFQAWVQTYVDHGISSTINLPAWGTDLNNEHTEAAFAATLMEYLPRLRGVTAYPDGARGGQPLTRVPYREAADAEGVEFEDGSEASCPSGVCGV
jgi:ribonucleoside-diphosphate reductase alpha chain